MIKFINPELFKLESTLVKGENGDYYKTVVSSSVKVTNRKTGDKVGKVITTIFSDTENFNSDEVNSAIKSKPTQNGTMRISINAFERNKYDTDIYIAAIPFNGIIDEIEKSFQYRIYRAVMVKADKRTIEFKGETYKKIAYMILVPNESMLEEDHKYHQDKLTLKVSSYNIETREETNETFKSTTTITFTKSDVVGDTNSSVDTISEVVEPINLDDFKGKVIFPIFKRETRDNNEETPNEDNKGNNKKRKRDSYYNKNPYDRMTDPKRRNKRH